MSEYKRELEAMVELCTLLSTILGYYFVLLFFKLTHIYIFQIHCM